MPAMPGPGTGSVVLSSLEAAPVQGGETGPRLMWTAAQSLRRESVETVVGSPVPPDRGRAVYHRLGSKVPRTRGSGRCSEGLLGGPGQGLVSSCRVSALNSDLSTVLSA